MAPPEDDKSHPGGLKIFASVDISDFNRDQQFAILASGAFFCALLFAALQERVFRVEGFKFSGYMTLLTQLTYVVCATFERHITGDTERRASLRDYGKLSLLTTSGMYLTNWSLKFISYATRVMFKSSKVLPVMVFSVLYVGHRYTVVECSSVLVLVVGIVVFMMGDVRGETTFDSRGVLLISGGVVVDALTANYEEKHFFHTCKSSQAELMLFSSALGVLWTLCSMFMSLELVPALSHTLVHPEVLPLTLLFAFAGYWSVSFILQLIKSFGATAAEIVKSCRKVLSIVLSFLLFGRQANRWHLMGGACFALSLLIKFYDKQAKRRKPLVEIAPV